MTERAPFEIPGRSSPRDHSKEDEWSGRPSNTFYQHIAAEVSPLIRYRNNPIAHHHTTQHAREARPAMIGSARRGQDLVE